MVLMCHFLFLLEDVAGVPLLLDLLQLGKALAPVARCPVTGERSGLRKSIGSVRRVKAFKIVNVVNIATGARDKRLHVSLVTSPSSLGSWRISNRLAPSLRSCSRCWTSPSPPGRGSLRWTPCANFEVLKNAQTAP